MLIEVQQLCIQYVVDEWRKLRPLKSRDEPPLAPPWAVWICFYDPISNRMNFIEARENALRKVWLLTASGIQERDPWEYARFIVTNWYCPWATGNRLPPRAIWGDYNQIAGAAFAHYDDSNDIYLQLQWGLRWGIGYRMVIAPAGSLRIEKSLWRS